MEWKELFAVPRQGDPSCPLAAVTVGGAYSIGEHLQDVLKYQRHTCISLLHYYLFISKRYIEVFVLNSK